MHHNDFYDCLPKHKIELVDGQALISGSREVSRMVLDSILQGYGPGYLEPMVNSDLLREACIEAFGRGNSTGGGQTAYPRVAPTLPVARMASELKMNLYMLDRYGVWGSDLVIKLGEDAFTPDIYLYDDPSDARQGPYYFEGVLDLVIEVMHPATRAFDSGLRLQRYQAAGVLELWLIDPERETVTVYLKGADSYAIRSIEDDTDLTSEVIPGLTVHPALLWQVKANPWQNYRDLATLADNTPAKASARKAPRWADKDAYHNPSLPFSPDIRLSPTPISFEQFMSWAPEAKFEWDGEKPHIGGGTDTNLHLTGLLLMTFGLTETVRLLPEEVWVAYL